MSREDEINRRVDDALSRVGSIQGQADRLRDEVARLRGRVDSLGAGLASAEARNAELRRERDEARDELAEYDELFALQRTRMGEATKAWQEATGKHDTLPDLGNLLAWLLGQIAGAKVAVTDASRERDASITRAKISEAALAAIHPKIKALYEAVNDHLTGLTSGRLTPAELKMSQVAGPALDAVDSAYREGGVFLKLLRTVEADRDHWRQAQRNAINAGDLLVEQRDMMRAALENVAPYLNKMVGEGSWCRDSEFCDAVAALNVALEWKPGT